MTCECGSVESMQHNVLVDVVTELSSSGSDQLGTDCSARVGPPRNQRGHTLRPSPDRDYLVSQVGRSVTRGLRWLGFSAAISSGCAANVIRCESRAGTRRCRREDLEMSTDRDGIEEVLASPGGVALLDALEAEQREDLGLFEVIEESDPGAVEGAAENVASMSFGDLVHHLVAGSERVGGPWLGDAPRRLVRAYRLAPARASIAAAVMSRFGASLRSDVSYAAQQWWTSAAGADAQVVADATMSGKRGVYCCGEFTWNALWTVSEPPGEVHDDLIDVWEMYPGPISRWRLPIEPAARVYEVHGPVDWVRLVARYPCLPTRVHGGWELPGPNQDRTAAHLLEDVSAGAAVRVGVRVAMPDWERVGEDYDGVHLSWAGKLTCEGRVVDVPDLGDDVVTMVRYWGSERTSWLNDVFGVPEPLAAPSLSGRTNGDVGIDANHAARRDDDARALAALVGRDLFSA